MQYTKIILFSAVLLLWSCRPQQRKKEQSSSIEKTEKLSFAKSFEQQLEKNGLDATLTWFETQKKSENFEFSESEINTLGYKLLYDLKKANAAIQVFSLNVQRFPKSANVYDSRGEAYLNNKNYQASIQDYQKAAKLNDRVLFHHLGFLSPIPYAPTKLPSDITELFIAKGNWNQDTAYVYVQGGPALQLNIHRKDALHLMPQSEKLLKIYPKQAQMVNPRMLVATPTLTQEQSKVENAHSVEILDRVLKHLTQQGKTVFLIGHSYGASICMEYLNTQKKLADKVVLMGLDLNEDISSWNKLKSGEYIRWKNGVTPYAKQVFSWVPADYPKKEAFNQVTDNLTSLIKSNMQKNYLKLLSQKTFAQLVSIYAENDEANGRKSAKEITFLRSKGTVVVSTKGNHHSMLTKEFMTKLYQYLTTGKGLSSDS
ncbi:MAG TPA: hypothetical protein DCS93_26235 [Microscillaceae bacterium]|nr:hypothetical protein [Microscillaceae bacterium]